MPLHSTCGEGGCAEKALRDKGYIWAAVVCSVCVVLFALLGLVI